MALVTVQRSPCGSTTSSNCQCQSTDERDGSNNQEKEDSLERKSVSECYFAVKGAALVLPHDECLHVHRKPISNGASDIQHHLQAMLYLLHPDDILKMAVKLESIHNGRTRYLVVASRVGRLQTEESCLLGIDCNNITSIGLVLPVWADTRITLDGDGGFSVTSSGRHHIFKPVSVQAMWSALQTLHKASTKARECNYFKAGGTHQWIDYYEKRITSDRSCLNEWHAMDDLESKRPPSPDTVRSRPTEREETEQHIRVKLKEVMMSVDLDEVTSKYIRTRLEEILDTNLKEYKPFIDQEMLTILGQMDAPTEIFQYLYLGSEWNASNLEELAVNGIGHILNVTREIDNFFPGVFDYQNIRVYDDESTEILHYWDKTYRYIRKAKDEGSKVLVHCKMGISRSASVVIAYVMKAYDWNLQQAFEFVKKKRNCIKPNSGFVKQLEIYQGILDASKHRHNSLWRSKSETNLKSSDKPKKGKSKDKDNGMPTKSESLRHLQIPGTTSRPKSWSPNDSVADMLFPPNGSMSSEALSSSIRSYDLKNMYSGNESKAMCDSQSSTLDFTCSDRLLPETTIPRVSSIKDRINELESQVSSTLESKTAKVEMKSPNSQSRSGLVLNLATQFEGGSKPSSPVDEGLLMKSAAEEIVEPVLSQTKPPVHKHHAVLVKPAMWPEENFSKPCLIANASTSAPLEQKDSAIKFPVSKPVGFQSAVSCASKKPSSNSKNGTSSAKILTSDKVFSISDKASHHDSAFRPVPVKINDNLRFDDKHDQVTVGNPQHTISATDKKPINTLPLVSKVQVSGVSPTKSSAMTNIGSSTAKPLGTLNFYQKHELKPSTTPLHNHSLTLEKDIDRNFQRQDTASKGIYDKEDIPFVPGTVQRTKQQLEEKSLRRTTSFDSGIPIHFGLLPFIPTDTEQGCGRPVRRSRSLRCDHRPTSMFSGKWYPLPALASLSPKPVRTTERNSVRPNSMIHSVSTPSVVEAVNQVICGTQEVLNSAIKCLPSEKSLVPSSGNASTDSELDFGSSSSLPDINMEDIFTERNISGGRSESPVPGIVRQQREILENKTPKSVFNDKNEICKKRTNCGKLTEPTCSLVSSDPSSKVEDAKDLGLVKRLTKELEAKSVSESHRKDKVSPMDVDGIKLKCSPPLSTEALSNQPSNVELGIGPRQISGLRSSLPSSIEKKLSHSGTSHPAPPTPHRKTSLDLNFLRKTSRFPLTLRLRNQSKSESSKTNETDRGDKFSGCLPTVKFSSLQRTNIELQGQNENPTDVFKVTAGRPPPAVKFHSLSPEIPPPPPLPVGPPRKLVRKQHGSTHPLSRLTIRQRHTNPLYNTM